MTFRFAAKHVLLTYAQCGTLDPWAVNNHLGSLGAECIIARETHADGGLHLHAFVEFERKFDSRNVRIFDVDGCHPNISQSYGTPEKGFDYAIKDGDVVAGGLQRPRGMGISSTRSKWHDIIDSPNREDFFATIASLDPRTLCVSFGNLVKYADWKYRVETQPYSTPPDIQFETGGIPRLGKWVRDNLECIPIGT